MKQWKRYFIGIAIAAAIVISLTGQTKFTPHANISLIDFVTPGLAITINSASISSKGVISVTYSLADPNGFPLDATGATTPGAVSLAYVAAYIPKGQEQYVAYTTGSATGAVLSTITRPDFELGGTATPIGPGQYQYTFIAQAPGGFDPTVTTTVAVDGNRNLTGFNMGTSYAGATFNFVPNGSAVTVTRDVIRTQSCNTCHDQLAFHGGYAHGMPMCVMCHQPQNLDPVTGNTLDLKVMAHKIHMGSQLPSVVGTTTTPGVPYQIAGYGNALSNFSTVVDPADPRRCEICHSQSTGAVQATAFMTEPSRAACGACHDNVNFATGLNHPAGFQADDTQCATCHVPKGSPFDASILGAHVVPADTALSYPQNPDTLITGDAIHITGVTNTSAGQKPVVAFTVKDTLGNPLAMSALEDLSFTMAGPTIDYGYTSFGSDVTTPGIVTEDGTVATCDASSNCTYTFLYAIPAKSTGTYAVAVESERLENILAGTTSTQQVESGTANQVVYFSVDGSAVANRRTVVQKANCNRCHVNLQGHGARRNDPEYCILCHNPSLTDAATRAMSTKPADLNAPALGLDFDFMVHRIHTGVNLAAMGASYLEISHNGREVSFNGILYPAMSPAGAATYTQNCAICHVNSSEQNLPTGLNQVTSPQYWFTPVGAVSAACSGCHASKAEAVHFLSNTDSLGESCSVCHAAGAQYAVDAVHTP